VKISVPIRGAFQAATSLPAPLGQGSAEPMPCSSGSATWPPGLLPVTTCRLAGERARDPGGALVCKSRWVRLEGLPNTVMRHARSA